MCAHTHLHFFCQYLLWNQCKQKYKQFIILHSIGISHSDVYDAVTMCKLCPEKEDRVRESSKVHHFCCASRTIVHVTLIDCHFLRVRLLCHMDETKCYELWLRTCAIARAHTNPSNYIVILSNKFIKDAIFPKIQFINRNSDIISSSSSDGHKNRKKVEEMRKVLIENPQDEWNEIWKQCSEFKLMKEIHWA